MQQGRNSPRGKSSFFRGVCAQTHVGCWEGSLLEDQCMNFRVGPIISFRVESLDRLVKPVRQSLRSANAADQALLWENQMLMSSCEPSKVFPATSGNPRCTRFQGDHKAQIGFSLCCFFRQRDAFGHFAKCKSVPSSRSTAICWQASSPGFPSAFGT